MRLTTVRTAKTTTAEPESLFFTHNKHLIALIYHELMHIDKLGDLFLCGTFIINIKLSIIESLINDNIYRFSKLNKTLLVIKKLSHSILLEALLFFS